MTPDVQGIIRRLRESIENSGLTYVDLEKKTGIAKSSIQRYANGTTKKVPIDAIQAIAKACGVSAAYIMGWESNVNKLPKENVFMRPLYNSVAAGFGVIADNTIISYIPTFVTAPSEQEQYIWVNVQGDSMSPLIDDGSKILVKKQDSVGSGQIGVVLVDGEKAVVKKITYGADWIELISVNPYYPPRRFEKAEVQRVRVLGLVKEVSKVLQ